MPIFAKQKPSEVEPLFVQRSLFKIGVKALANRIESELQRAQWKHSAVSENELKRLWPLDAKEREAKITEFAKTYGFRLRFYRKGLCAIFDKWPRTYCEGGTGEDCNAATAGPVRREEIALYAYYIWQTEGRPEGRALEHWLQAELQLRTANVLDAPRRQI